MSSIYRTPALAFAIAAVTLVSMACGGDNNPSAPEPQPDPPTVTETFQGSIAQSQNACHDFTLVANGDVELVLTDLQPLLTLTVGLALGTPDATVVTGCFPFAQDDSVRVNETLLAGNLSAGDFCACVYDVGNIFPGATVTYTLDVTHP